MLRFARPGYYFVRENGKFVWPGSRNKKRPAFLLVLRAVGETRTRTGLLPLPPQSSVSTISPPPLEFGIAKVRQKSKLPNISLYFFKKDFSFGELEKNLYLCALFLEKENAGNH